ncbi:MAG: hydroxyacylglutathione hydrolase [Pseudomonadota bacterium]
MPASPSIEAIPILQNNYVWALHDGEHAVLVDPGRAEPALDWLQSRALQLTGLLITHHHWDHTDGVDEILEAHPVPVYGPSDDRITQVDHPVDEGVQVHLERPNITLDVLSVPGHTSIHLAFVGRDFVLCGDTLFSAGCGRLFEGTPEQMQASLDKLARLPGSTRVFCTHEYTLDNCGFALQVEPDNVDLIARAKQVRQWRSEGKISLPSTIGDERKFNPFLRTREPAVIQAALKRDPEAGVEPAQVLATIRRWKDQI